MEPCSIQLALQHVLVITTLNSSRNQHMKNTCSNAAISCTMFPAMSKELVDLQKLRAASYAAPPLLRSTSTIPRHNLTAGEFALSITHRNAYDALLLNRWPCALILENDAAFRASFATQIQALYLPPTFDVIKLEACNSQQEAAQNIRVRLAHGQGGWCTAAYMVSYQGAKLLRSLQTPVWLVSDGAFRVLDPRNNRHLEGTLNKTAATTSGLRPIEIYHTVPPLAWQQNNGVREKSPEGDSWSKS